MHRTVLIQVFISAIQTSMLKWIQEHDVLLASLGGLGILLLAGSILVVPLVVACMREDYFIRVRAGTLRQGFLRNLGHWLKNLLGALLVLLGVLLLLLPGQGLLMILIGLGLVDFPGKIQLQLRLVRIRGLRQSISWIRHRAGKADLVLPDAPVPGSAPSRE